MKLRESIFKWFFSLVTSCSLDLYKFSKSEEKIYRVQKQQLYISHPFHLPSLPFPSSRMYSYLFCLWLSYILINVVFQLIWKADTQMIQQIKLWEGKSALHAGPENRFVSLLSV